MMASVEEAVGVHAEDLVAAVVAVGLTNILLMVRILLAAVMGSLEGTKLQKMEIQRSTPKGELDMEDLVGSSAVAAVVDSAMVTLQMNAPGERLSDEVELDVGKSFKGTSKMTYAYSTFLFFFFPGDQLVTMCLAAYLAGMT